MRTRRPKTLPAVPSLVFYESCILPSSGREDDDDECVDTMGDVNYSEGAEENNALRRAPPAVCLPRGDMPFVSRNSLIAAAISKTRVSAAKCPVSRNRTCS